MGKSLSDMSLEELWQLFPIILTEHQPCWSEWFREETARLQKALPMEKIVRISHIGSTAIEGIWAKPIVDILAEVDESTKLSDIKPLIVNSGYICMDESERRISFNKGYTPEGFADKVFHLHLRYKGDHDELYFRDYLRTHPQVAREYEQLKLALWKLYEHDRNAYTEHKSRFVAMYTAKGKQTSFPGGKRDLTNHAFAFDE